MALSQSKSPFRVDVTRLKEMNVQFLKSIMEKNEGSVASVLKDDKLEPLRNADMCLTSLLVRRHQHERLQQQQQVQHQHRERRHSVGGYTVPENQLNFREHPFLALRRDSLH